MKNYYQILNVKPTATEAEIKTRYRLLAKRYHPDVNPGDSAAASKFADISEAYSTLSDPKLRAEYDAKLKEASMPHAQEDVIARQRAQAQAAARQAAYRNMNGMGNGGRRDSTILRARQAQAQAQVQALCNQAFANGREQGAAEVRKAAEAEIAKLKASLQNALSENRKLRAMRGEADELRQKLETAENDRRDLEQELFNRDKEFTQGQARIKELEEELAKVKEQAEHSNSSRHEVSELRTKLTEAQVRIKELERSVKTITAERDKLKLELEKVEAHCKQLEQNYKQAELRNAAQIELQQERRKKMQDEIAELNAQIANLQQEIQALREENDNWVRYAKSEEFLSDTEQRIQAWTKKTNADKRLAKSTLYADLGVLIWATDEQIAAAHAKLVKKYSGKTDPAIVEKLRKAEEAFAVLSNPERRKQYNETIGITEERIEQERRLIAENDSLMAEYRNQLADREFWAKFDELTEQAMSGDADAQFRLGEMYYNGTEIDQDLEQAAFWFKEAAKQKHADAMYYLGVCYVNGEGVEKNDATGRGFIRQAAKLGSKHALGTNSTGTKTKKTTKQS